ncbi:hypothetical protein QC764_001510 [Podospora pseudoanserina]|uniref:ABM domain-containing protein n=1 Tax=Podospora pseudoanserina TaxID=2609844 RepID=A0ABR0I4G3_9PEZI|nr:hypothetical protein QC764_001510 [Podospora pseudoanserina]
MPSALPSDTSTTNSKSPPEPASAVDIIITLAINPENKEQVEANLLKAGEWIEKNEPGCLQWEVFYLEATGEMVLVERFNDLQTARKYHPENRKKDGMIDGGLKWANEIVEKGWLSQEPDIKVLSRRGGFGLRKWQ